MPLTNEAKLEELDRDYYRAVDSLFGFFFVTRHPLPPSEYYRTLENKTIMSKLVSNPYVEKK